MGVDFNVKEREDWEILEDGYVAFEQAYHSDNMLGEFKHKLEITLTEHKLSFNDKLLNDLIRNYSEILEVRHDLYFTGYKYDG